MIRSLVLASFLLLACGGSKPVPTSIEGARTGAPPAPKSDAAPETPRLAIGPLKVVMTDGAKRMELAVAADGSVAVAAGEAAKHDVRVTAYGELESDGKTAAKLADNGALSVLEESIEKVDGKVVKSESTWTTVGVLDADGSFTAAKDNRKISIDHDGKVTGLPGKMEIAIEGAPAHRRAGMFLVIGIMSGGRRISETTSASGNQVVPVQPIKP